MKGTWLKCLEETSGLAEVTEVVHQSWKLARSPSGGYSVIADRALRVPSTAAFYRESEVRKKGAGEDQRATDSVLTERKWGVFRTESVVNHADCSGGSRYEYTGRVC